MYHIINVITNILYIHPLTGAAAVYSSKDAAISVIQTFPNFEKFRPIVAINDDWKDREHERFKMGYYHRPAMLDPYALPLHFLHVSNNNPPLLCYTQNEEKGCLDKQSKISLSGYLERFHPTIKEFDRHIICSQYSALAIEYDGLKFTSSPEEIVKVYRNYCPGRLGVASSCMRGTFKTSVHPTYVYGAGDLAIAYLVDDKGRTTDRALCWPEKKIYGRVYGDSRLHECLKVRGYRASQFHTGSTKDSMEGARLLAIPYKDNYYIMPCVDEPIKASLTEDKKYFVLQRKGLAVLTGTGGFTIIPKPQICARCNAETTEMRMETVSTSADARTYARWCADCKNNHSFYCDGVGVRYDKSIPHYPTIEGVFWSANYLEGNRGFLCEKDKIAYPVRYKRYRVIAEIVENTSSVLSTRLEIWGRRAFENYAQRIPGGEDYYDKTKPELVQAFSK